MAKTWARLGQVGPKSGPRRPPLAPDLPRTWARVRAQVGTKSTATCARLGQDLGGPGLGPDLAKSGPSQGQVDRELGPTWPGLGPDLHGQVGPKSRPSRPRFRRDLARTWPDMTKSSPSRSQVGRGLGPTSLGRADLAKSGPTRPRLGPDLAGAWARLAQVGLKSGSSRPRLWPDLAGTWARLGCFGCREFGIRNGGTILFSSDLGFGMGAPLFFKRRRIWDGQPSF